MTYSLFDTSSLEPYLSPDEEDGIEMVIYYSNMAREEDGKSQEGLNEEEVRVAERGRQMRGSRSSFNHA